MKNLIKNYAPYKLQVLIVALFLIVQAYCDMSLPTYTSDLIDVGIQNGGIEHILPEKITQEDFIATQMVMTDEEKEMWQSAYTGSGNYSVLERKAMDETELDKYDEKLLEPIVIIYQAEQSMLDSYNSENYSQNTSSEYSAYASMSVDEIRAELHNKIEAVGSQTLMAMGCKYARACDEAAGLDVDKIQSEYLWSCGGKMLLMTALMVLAAAVVSLISSRVGAGIGMSLRRNVFKKVMSFSNSEMDKFSISSLITRATNDIQQVQMVSTMLLRMVLMAPIMAVWGIIKVYNTRANMSSIIVAGVIVLLISMGILMVVAMPKFKIMQTLIDKLNLVSREMLTGMPVIRAFGREEGAEEEFDKANTNLMNNQLFVGRTMSLLWPMMMIILYAITIIITWVAAHRIDAGTMQVGAMTAFITYSMMIITSFLIIAGMSIILPRAGVAADRINEVLSTESSINNCENPEELTDCRGDIEFNNVCFKYNNANENCLENISFTAKAGETTAIIGSTGCGKTTLVNLIPRFYDVTEGQITIDGKDIRDYSIKSLRQAIGFVAQKGILFSGTVASNIRFGNENATDEEVRRYADIAQASEFIEEKEDGFDSEIAQGGSNVSGGQKQRLSIARALAKEPPILIFDESFSALDMKTDMKLRKALAEEAKASTRIIVAQRVGTILSAEQIIVLDEGRIVGKGTHEQLMKACNVYRQIAESQLSLKELGGVQ